MLFRSQKRVAEQVRARTADARLVALGWAELLFLMRYENPLPVVYWNYAAYGYHADVDQESFGDAAVRMLAIQGVHHLTVRARSSNPATYLKTWCRPTTASTSRFAIRPSMLPKQRPAVAASASGATLASSTPSASCPPLTSAVRRQNFGVKAGRQHSLRCWRKKVAA